MKPIALASALTFALGTAVAAEQIVDSEYAVGNWRGAAYTYIGTRDFYYCDASVEFVSGETLHLYVHQDQTLGIGLSNASYRVRDGEEFQLTIQIDRGQRFTGPAHAEAEGFFVGTFQEISAITPAIARGRSLHLTSGQVNFGSFDLSGSYRALQRAIDCTLAYIDFQNRGGVPRVHPR